MKKPTAARPKDGLILARDLPLLRDALPFLNVRNNDEHTVVAYGVARMLLKEIPEAKESVVLPAIILHDVGWKRVPQEFLLDAVGKNPTRPDLVREHELHSVVIARDILTRRKPKGVDVEAVLAIIDGHDTTTPARSLEDAVMKDADKGWRTTPHGMRIIRSWYDWDVAEYVEMITKVSNPRMLTAPGRALAEGFTASLRAELELAKYVETT
jgi:HD domain